jgi:hypothetical protein
MTGIVGGETTSVGLPDRIPTFRLIAQLDAGLHTSYTLTPAL